MNFFLGVLIITSNIIFYSGKEIPIDLGLDEPSIPYSLSKKSLGISKDSNLNFEEHVSDLFNIVSKKLNALSRIAGYMENVEFQ